MKTQISLRIRAVWSESSSTAYRNFASLVTQNAPSEDSDQTARMRRLIWIFAGRTYQKVRLLALRFKCLCAVEFHHCVFTRCIMSRNMRKMVLWLRSTRMSVHFDSSICFAIFIDFNFTPYISHYLHAWSYCKYNLDILFISWNKKSSHNYFTLSSLSGLESLNLDMSTGVKREFQFKLINRMANSVDGSSLFAQVPGLLCRTERIKALNKFAADDILFFCMITFLFFG